MLQQITPKQAWAWLKDADVAHLTEGDHASIDRLAEKLKTGMACSTTMPIVIDPNGTAVEGRKRLLAILFSGSTLAANVLHIEKEEA